MNLQDVATRNHRFVGTVRTVTASVAEAIAIDYLAIITAPLADHSVVGHSARVVVLVAVAVLVEVEGSILAPESPNGVPDIGRCRFDDTGEEVLLGLFGTLVGILMLMVIVIVVGHSGSSVEVISSPVVVFVVMVVVIGSPVIVT